MELSQYFGEGQIFYYWKGRVGLFILLKALGIQPGDEVILPGFTCVVVPNAILYNGGKPVYADIDPESYNASAKTIEPLITSRTRVIIAQNTFGLSPDVDPIMELARPRDIYVIEDCTQGLGGLYKGRPVGLTADAAFFSTQWSKPISTGLGGILWLRNKDVATKVSALTGKLPPPGNGEEFILTLQRLVRPLADQPVLHYLLVGLYRFLTQKLGVSGSSGGKELSGIDMPGNYLKLMGRGQKRVLEKGLGDLRARIKSRQENSEWYDQFFLSRRLSSPYRPVYAEHSMLRYTIRVPNKEELLNKANRLHIPLGDWFVSPLHPVKGDLTQWLYTAGQCPEAEKASLETINLSTDRPLSLKQLSELFLK
jgi:perosamine synthetase